MHKLLPATTRDLGKNERLSKRLALLNLGMHGESINTHLFHSIISAAHNFNQTEQNGQKLYVPVENPTASSSPASTQLPSHRAAALNPPPPTDDGGAMAVDDTKHRVYIYSLDDELSGSDSEPDEGRLVFLPDIERHLRSRRMGFTSPASPPIPRPVPEGDSSDMQLVLYRDPTSLSVPADQDGVRRAVIESRARSREQNRRERGGLAGFAGMPAPIDQQVVQGPDSMDMDMDID
ncbi:hypothetical protein ACRALDRAFT_2048365 [Sodiomyces alcalophilus JCM 7366]|uniref:uncharacterized protein n=1 Tax=Sodiomyces alcalophilus JCM 7366 TaxID=591952 RepID=UPI0039B6DD0B